MCLTEKARSRADRAFLRYRAVVKISGVVAAGVLSLALAGCTSSAKHVTVSVVSWTPEDAHHVAAIVRFTNSGTDAATAICSIGVYDRGGSQVGSDTDGPADNVAAGKSATVRLVIKTDVDTSAVAAVRWDSGVPCA